MTYRLALSTLAFVNLTGQQVYEQELVGRAQGELGDGWSVDRIVMKTLRSPLPGTVRIPSHLLINASPGFRRAAGRYFYRGHDVVHRFDLRLPPAPRPEVLTVLDVVPWRFDDETQPPSDAASTARRASIVICPSQFSADEVSFQLGVTDPVAIHCGVNQRFFGSTPLSEKTLGALGIRVPFILHAGGCTQRKNLAALAGAWPIVRAAHPGAMLVLMGPRYSSGQAVRSTFWGQLCRLGRRRHEAWRLGLGECRRRPVDLRGIRTASTRGHGRGSPSGRRRSQLVARSVRRRRLHG